MISFLMFAIARYSRICSHVAAFLAGVGLSIGGEYFWMPLAIAIVLGSLAAYLGDRAAAQ